MMLAAATAAAQDSSARPRDRAQRGDRAPAGKLDAKTTGASIRASQLIGMNIQNSQGKSVGEINDLVLDANTGKVRYAAVTYGGFLGIGNKMFAVPFSAFKCQQDPDDADEYVLVLNVTQETLEGAQGFDEEHWPNFANRNFTNEVDRRYGVERRARDEVDVQVEPTGVDVDVQKKPRGERD
jgi:sporulation protein YlmC with PRC-barrel domain